MYNKQHRCVVSSSVAHFEIYVYIMTCPVILICARNEEVALKIIKGITEGATSSIEESTTQSSGTLWNIVNKYYQAEVLLRPFLDGQYLENTSENVEAAIIYIDHGESLAVAENRWKTLNLGNSEVNILLCNKCDDSFPYEQVTVWCLEKDFQLIQLLEEPEPIDDSCVIKDYYGMDRVIQTLHANAWSNHDLLDESIDNNHHIENEEDSLCEEEDALEHMDEFCKLFSQMTSVTQNASSMPTEGRRAYAEQVVKAFWKAIGGDESELEDDTNV